MFVYCTVQTFIAGIRIWKRHAGQDTYLVEKGGKKGGKKEKIGGKKGGKKEKRTREKYKEKRQKRRERKGEKCVKKEEETLGKSQFAKFLTRLLSAAAL